MIKPLFFLLKVAILVGVCVWVANQSGSVTFEWFNQSLSVHIGVFLLGLVMIMLLGMFVFTLLHEALKIPQYLGQKNNEKGYKALTLGLSAMAAGDLKHARYQSYRAKKLLQQKDHSLSLLLEAQVARMEGKEGNAKKVFSQLMKNKEGAFLGVRGLLQGAIDHGDFKQALDFARQAQKIHPKQPWIVRTVYDLEMRLKDWDQAQRTLKRVEKLGALNKEKIKTDKIAMLLVKGDKALEADNRDQAFKEYKKAYHLNTSFSPTIERVVPQYVQRRSRKKAQKIIEKAWKDNPHPDLVKLWDIVMPAQKKNEMMGRVLWFEKLRSLSAHSSEGYIALARVQKEQGLWAEMRKSLLEAEKIEKTQALYYLLAELEEKKISRSSDVIEENRFIEELSQEQMEARDHWLQKASELPLDQSWVCMDSGRPYEVWVGHTEPWAQFNSLRWQRPDLDKAHLAGALAQQNLLDVPA